MSQRHSLQPALSGLFTDPRLSIRPAVKPAKTSRSSITRITAGSPFIFLSTRPQLPPSSFVFHLFSSSFSLPTICRSVCCSTCPPFFFCLTFQRVANETEKIFTHFFPSFSFFLMLKKKTKYKEKYYKIWAPMATCFTTTDNVARKKAYPCRSGHHCASGRTRSQHGVAATCHTTRQTCGRTRWDGI